MFDVAKKKAERATCPTRPAGAVLVTGDAQEVYGWEGAPRGMAHCDLLGCPLVNGECQNAVNAEVNVILRAAYQGISTENSTLYLTHPLLLSSVPLLTNAGVIEVVCPRIEDAVLEALDLAGILYEQVG